MGQNLLIGAAATSHDVTTLTAATMDLPTGVSIDDEEGDIVVTSHVQGTLATADSTTSNSRFRSNERHRGARCCARRVVTMREEPGRHRSPRMQVLRSRHE